MNHTFFELVWIFFVYSFVGWVLETIVGTINRKQFINRGFVTGPICMVYKIASSRNECISMGAIGKYSCSIFGMCSNCDHNRMVCWKTSGKDEQEEMVGLFP